MMEGGYSNYSKIYLGVHNFTNGIRFFLVMYLLFKRVLSLHLIILVIYKYFRIRKSNLYFVNYIYIPDRLYPSGPPVNPLRLSNFLHCLLGMELVPPFI